MSILKIEFSSQKKVGWHFTYEKAYFSHKIQITPRIEPGWLTKVDD